MPSLPLTSGLIAAVIYLVISLATGGSALAAVIGAIVVGSIAYVAVSLSRGRTRKPRR